MKYPDSEFEFRQCKESDLDQILFIQEEAFRNLDNTDLLRRNTPEMLTACLDEPHYTLGVFHQDKLIAFGILYDGLQSEENIGNDIGISEDNLSEVINFKLVIVLPDYRGNSLQKKIINHLSEKAVEKGKKIICATVSPDNVHSIRNFENAGFILHCVKTKYGGLKRNIYYKNL